MQKTYLFISKVSCSFCVFFFKPIQTSGLFFLKEKSQILLERFFEAWYTVLDGFTCVSFYSRRLYIHHIIFLCAFFILFL